MYCRLQVKSAMGMPFILEETCDGMWNQQGVRPFNELDKAKTKTTISQKGRNSDSIPVPMIPKHTIKNEAALNGTLDCHGPWT